MHIVKFLQLDLYIANTNCKNFYLSKDLKKKDSIAHYIFFIIVILFQNNIITILVGEI